jgi:MarR family transcriptional regulator, organic hydroperoxide resistance regulator
LSRRFGLDTFSAMSAESLYALLERISNLLRNEERAVGQEHGLQPVHLQALHYLSVCNRYSNTPAGLTEYLGLTKGTVSQTIALLEGKGLLEKESSSTDRRVTHLHLTGEGRALLGALLPPALFSRTLEGLPDGGRGLEASLTGLLRALLVTHAQPSFGVCASCRHFQREPQGRFRCGLTQEPLSRADSALLCREHSAPDV